MKHNFGKSPQKQAHARSLSKAERQQLQDGCAARHRFSNALHERSLLRAGKEPLPRLAGMRVDQSANVIEQLGRVLDLIENDGRVQTVKKPAWIAADALPNIGILQQNVL